MPRICLENGESDDETGNYLFDSNNENVKSNSWINGKEDLDVGGCISLSKSFFSPSLFAVFLSFQSGFPPAFELNFTGFSTVIPASVSCVSRERIKGKA